MPLINFFSKKDTHGPDTSIIWEMLLFVLIVGLLLLLALTTTDMFMAYELGDPIIIDLSPSKLPYYAFRTVLRMFIALFLSLICAFIFGSLAAKNPVAEKIIIPSIDIMQSIPVIGFLELSFLYVIHLFKGSFIGPELISIFAVFVSQVWNLILSYYESLKMIPKELDEVMQIYKLSSWQRFFRLEIPHAAPGLIWNAMLSLSAGWFFVVAGEAITIANHNVSLPGIGSYIAVATQQGNYSAIYYAIFCLFVVIMIYDQLIFRPLNYWLVSRNQLESKSNWIYSLFSRSQVITWFLQSISRFGNFWGWFLPKRSRFKRSSRNRGYASWLLLIVLGYLLFVLSQSIYSFSEITEWSDVIHALILGSYTALRVFVLVFLCCVVWVPIGVFLGVNDRVAGFFQPVIQFLAAFPPNMLYPLVGSMIIVKGYNPNIWLSPLIILGTQWYILFNVIAGVRALPEDLLLMAKSLGLKGLSMYRKVIIPGILPSLLTGVITAFGGAWNTSIIAEVAEWQGDVVYCDGLGAYIMQASRNADTHLVCLGVVVMCLYVFLINRVLWLPLYRYIERRYGRGRCQGQY